MKGAAISVEKQMPKQWIYKKHETFTVTRESRAKLAETLTTLINSGQKLVGILTRNNENNVDIVTVKVEVVKDREVEVKEGEEYIPEIAK